MEYKNVVEKINRGEKMEKSALFINKLNEDTEFASALVVATETAVTKEENIAATTKFANEAGFEVSSDELQKYVESIQNPSNELSDEDLNNVAGGFSEDGKDIGIAIGTGAGTAIGTVGGAVGGGFIGAAIGGVGAVPGLAIGGTAGGAAGLAIGSVAGGVIGGNFGEDIGKVFSGW